MEQEVEPQDEDGVDGRRLMGGMGGNVIWVLWTTHRFSGWYVDWGFHNVRWCPDENFDLTCRFGCWWGGRHFWVTCSPIAFV